MKINTYLINLDGSDERLSSASQQLNHQSISFTRISAFDGRSLDPQTIPEYQIKKSLNYMGRELKGGELGCYFSHLNAAKAFLASDADYAIVLEDDMQLNTDIMPVLRDYLIHLTTQSIDWHLMNIGVKKHKIFTPLIMSNGHTLIHAHYFPMTTTGVVWSRQGAEAFYQSAFPIFCPIDNYFRYWLTKSNKGLSVQPPLVVASGAESDIDGQTQPRKHGKRHPLYGLIKQRRLWVDKLTALKNKTITAYLNE